MFEFRELYYRFLNESLRGRKRAMMFGLVTEVIHTAEEQPRGGQRHFRAMVKTSKRSKKAYSGSGQHPTGKLERRKGKVTCL